MALFGATFIRQGIQPFILYYPAVRLIDVDVHLYEQVYMEREE